MHGLYTVVNTERATIKANIQFANATNLATSPAMMAPPGECKRNLTLHACQCVRVWPPHRRHFSQLGDRQINIGTQRWANIWRR